MFKLLPHALIPVDLVLQGVVNYQYTAILRPLSCVLTHAEEASAVFCFKQNLSPYFFSFILFKELTNISNTRGSCGMLQSFSVTF